VSLLCFCQPLQGRGRISPLSKQLRVSGWPIITIQFLETLQLALRLSLPAQNMLDQCQEIVPIVIIQECRRRLTQSKRLLHVAGADQDSNLQSIYAM
jgi:predicted amidohydrolase YtcJ